MSDEQQQEAERRRRFGIPSAVDPRHLDPRKMMDPAAMEKLMRAQAIARAEAQAATTVAIATIISLVTSAFSFIAAFAWNTAMTDALKGLVTKKIGPFTLTPIEVEFVYAIIVTLIAVMVILIVNRFAGNIAKRSAIAAASAS